MIVDSSALIAILNEEPPAPRCLEALLASPATLMSAANLLEAAIAMDRHPSPVLGPALDDLIARLRIAIEPVTLSQVVIARDAHRRFGRAPGFLRGSTSVIASPTRWRVNSTSPCFLSVRTLSTRTFGVSSTDPIAILSPPHSATAAAI